ncbi:MAG: GIY-YIG nuclease family protein [Verrucomicrobia bacterium]|nr:GIY-YIG nuclease family protein [Verrucomicrobiota bacterium]
MHFVYVLENATGKLYVGQTENLDTRLANHNRTDRIGGKFARKHGPWRLVWSEAHSNRGDAMARERHIKAMKSSRWIRDHLLNGRVPTGRD